MINVDTIEYDVELYQVQMSMVNCTYLQLKLLNFSIANKRNVAKTDMNGTYI